VRDVPEPAAGHTGARLAAERPELVIAVPRGALLADTLDVLDRLGIDTTEVRENDRRLLFALHGRSRSRRYALIRTDRDWLLHLTNEQPG